jgi:NTE family protein
MLLGVRMVEADARQFGARPAALILCGGGSRGAMEVGFYRTLTELGLRVDFILGSSIGALNGAYIAGGMTPDKLAGLWCDFRLRQTLSINWRWLLDRHRRPGFFSLKPLRERLRRTLPAMRLEDLAIPLNVVTTDLESGHAHYWSGQGDLIEPVIASISLLGIFPPVEMDGGSTSMAASPTMRRLTRRLRLAPIRSISSKCACAERCSRPPRGWADILMRSFSIALDGKYRTDLTHFAGSLTIHTVRPQLRNEVDLLEFCHSAELIETAYGNDPGSFRTANSSAVEDHMTKVSIIRAVPAKGWARRSDGARRLCK